MTIRLVNAADLSPADDAFVDLAAVGRDDVAWRSVSGLPANWLERRITRPRLSRYRAALAAGLLARRSDALISHLPRLTAAIGTMEKVGPRKPHLAFSFNFTQLPEGRSLRYFRSALAGVTQFCVFSHYERRLYSDMFSIPQERFVPTLWTQQAPPVSPPPDVPTMPYVAAIGGEGRDFATLLAAARATPHIRYVVVARPSAALAEHPANVSVVYNVPLARTWGIAAGASAVLVPLLTPTTCCGHVTIVSAQLLGRPVISSRSAATTEYFDRLESNILHDCGDADALAAAVVRAVDDPGLAAAAARDRVEASARYDRVHWAAYVDAFLRAHVDPGRN